jgi:hypothetical protein
LLARKIPEIRALEQQRFAGAVEKPCIRCARLWLNNFANFLDGYTGFPRNVTKWGKSGALDHAQNLVIIPTSQRVLDESRIGAIAIRLRKWDTPNSIAAETPDRDKV